MEIIAAPLRAHSNHHVHLVGANYAQFQEQQVRHCPTVFFHIIKIFQEIDPYKL